MSCQLKQLNMVARRQSALTALFQHRIGLAWFVKRRVNYLARKLLRWPKNASRGGRPEPNHAASTVPTVELRAGDLVRVRSKKDIQKTLDDWGRHKNCEFAAEMYQYCGQTYRVLKKVEQFYDEVRQRMCKCRGIVLLRGLTCCGKRGMFPQPCDRNCFLFWHSVWLEKIEQ